MGDLTDMIVEKFKDKRLDVFQRLFTLPYFKRTDDARVHDLAAEVFSYKKSGIDACIDEITRKDKALGKSVYEDVFRDGYVTELMNGYRPAIRVAEANDTWDKISAFVETGLDISVVGIPISYILRAISVIGPTAALTTLGVYTHKMNKDPETRGKQRNFYLGAVAGLGFVEALEYIPVVNELANVADAFDLYIMAADKVIARGTSRKQFEAYFQKNFPALYAAAIGGGEIIDAEFEDYDPSTIQPPLPLDGG